MGAALMGQKVGQTVTVSLPNGGTIDFKILEISRAAL